MSRGNNRGPIFSQASDYRKLLAIFADGCRQFRAQIHAYCLMPNHYHVFLETKEPTLSEFMRHANGVYTQWFNYRHQRVGHVMQGRFKAVLVERESFGLELSRYIHLNPCRAKLARSPEDYMWSSARCFLGLVPAPGWLAVEWTLAQFAHRRLEAQDAYRKFLSDGMKESPAAFDRIGQVRGCVLGSEAFVERIVSNWMEMREDKELSDFRTLIPRPTIEQVIRRVEEYYRRPTDTICLAGSRDHEPRRIAMYLARRLAGCLHEEIAAHFGGIGYTAVSQCVRRVEARRGRDEKFAAVVREIEASLSTKECRVKT
jgi:REP element-mobilizing transposase RayT